MPRQLRAEAHRQIQQQLFDIGFCWLGRGRGPEAQKVQTVANDVNAYFIYFNEPINGQPNKTFEVEDGFSDLQTRVDKFFFAFNDSDKWLELAKQTFRKSDIEIGKRYRHRAMLNVYLGCGTDTRSEKELVIVESPEKTVIGRFIICSEDDFSFWNGFYPI